MTTSSVFLLTIGGILLLGLLLSAVAHRTFLPRVTLLLLFGILIGEESLDIIPHVFADRFEIIADMTLLMVGFLIGGKLSLSTLSQSKQDVLWVSIVAALATASLVTLGLAAAGISLEIAILLGCIASATAPAAVLDVIDELDVNNRFSNILLSIVAVDDVWALLLFGIGLATVSTMNGFAGETSTVVMIAREIGGAILLGVAMGLPAAYLSGRIKQGQPMLTEALGLVFVCGGLAMWLGVSYLIASIVMGAIISNLAKHHEYPFHAIEGIEWPFMVIFFTLAGASLDLSMMKEIGLIGAVYILCRVFGKYLGAKVGATISGADQGVKNWMGIAMLPQAGVPIGMALVASNQFPEYRQMLLSVVIGTTVFFDVVGPVFTRIAIKKTTSSS